MKILKKILTVITILFIVIFANNIYDKYSDEIDSIINFVAVSSNAIDIDVMDSIGNLISDNEIDLLDNSNVAYSNYDFDTDYYPYYGMLSQNEQTLYKQIYANASALSIAFIPDIEISKDKINTIIEAVYYDHPELFYLDNSYSYKYTSSGNVAQITLEYTFTSNTIDDANIEFNSSANKIINEALKLSTDYQKEKYVHDTLLEMITYNKNADLNQSAYSALVNNSSVCAGYTKAFQYIMTKLNIPTFYVTGDADGSHAWNIIKLDDGYYNVDLTWDDSELSNYKYFNISDKILSKSHTRTSLSIYLPECNGSKYSNLENNNDNNTKNYSNTKNTEIVIIDNNDNFSNEIENEDIMTQDIYNNNIEENEEINNENTFYDIFDFIE